MAPDFWLKLLMDRVVLTLSRFSTREKQLDMLQDLHFFIYKLQREIYLNGRLEGVHDRKRKED